MSRRTALCSLIVLVAFIASAADFPVSDAVLGNPPDYRNGFVAASDGDGFLVAWIDRRSVDAMLLAARVTRGGQVLDPTGIPLARAAGRPQVVWNGQQYLVFWESAGSLLAANVNRDGTTGAPRTILQNVNFDPYRGASIATNGSRIAMVYGDRIGFQGSPDQLRVGIFSLDATLIRESVVDQSDVQNQYRLTRLLPSIAVNNAQFTVAWNVFLPATDALELHAARFSSDGTQIDPQPRTIGSASLESTIAANGSGYVVVSQFSSWGVSGDLATITPAVELPLSAGENAVVIHRAGRATLFGLQQEGESQVLSAADFDAQGHGAVVQPLSLPSQGALAAASNGNEVAVLWLGEALSEDNPPVVTAIVNATSLQRLTPIVPLTRSASRQSGPAVAASDSDTLAAWQESGGIYAGRVLSNGTRVDGRGVRLSDGERDGFPSVVFDGQRYVIAFTHYKDFRDAEIVVRFVSPSSGLLSNEIRIPGADVGLEVALAKSNDAVLLVWMDDQRLFASRINSAMQLIDPPIQIASNGPASPVAAWNGSQFLIAWRTTVFDFDYTFYPSIAGIRMTAGLTAIDTEPRILGQADNREHLNASIAWNGSNWLVAFATHPPFSSGPEEVRLVQLDAGSTEGTILGNGYAPQLVTAGLRTWIAWKEATNDRALRVAAIDGSSLQRIAAPTPLNSSWQERFGIAAKGSTILLAYPRISGIDAGSVLRVYVNSITPSTAPAKRRSAHH